MTTMPLRHHDTSSCNFLRAYRGEVLDAAQFVTTGRRIVVISSPRHPGDADEPAVIALPPIRQWLARDVTVIGTGFRLEPAVGEKIDGTLIGECSTTRVLPLIGDRADEPDRWVIVR